MDGLIKLQSIFKTLSDYNRLLLIKAICDKEYSVGELVKITNLSQPLVSHHLKTLKNNHILDTKREGPFIYYFIKDEKILYGIDLFLEIFKDVEIDEVADFRFCSDKIMNKFNKIYRR